MLTLKEIKEKINDRTFDNRFYNRLSQFLTYEELQEYGFDIQLENITPEEWNEQVRPFTKKNILEQLKEDVEFGFKKALDKRGISSALMFETVLNWNKILQDGLEDWDEDHYAMYGLPLFKATAVKYGWYNPIGSDIGDESYYNEDNDYMMSLYD